MQQQALFVESYLLATHSEHLDSMREIAGQLASLQSESSSLLVICDTCQQRCNHLKRQADRHGTLLEYYDR